MNRAEVFEVVAKGVGLERHPPCEYEIERALPKVSKSMIWDFLKYLQANDLIKDCPYSSARGRNPKRLTEKGRRVFERIVQPLLNAPQHMDYLENFPSEELAVAFQAKLVERTDRHFAPLEWRRMVQLDPELTAVFPVLREIIEGFPLLDALANRKLVSTLKANLLDRIKHRNGPLSVFIQ
jgi:DNA-binding PadR family transcriptional regulator